jgi:UPF0716 protein FxsA
MLKRVLIALCVLVILDMLLLAALSYFVGWQLPLGESIVGVILGIAVITGYRSCWSKAIGDSLNSEYLDIASCQQCLAEMLLLVAGILIVIPGLMGDTLGLLLLVPWFRRRVARRLWPEC